MDRYYYNKYSKYVKQNDGRKAGINLFLVFKKIRSSCFIFIHKRYQKSFEKILTYYEMNYINKIDDIFLQYLISKKRIHTSIYESFLKKCSDWNNIDHELIGKFLEYPYLINIKNVAKNKFQNIGAIQFVFEYKKNKKEIIYGFRIPNDSINNKIINKMNNILKKYKKCLNELFDNPFTIELNIRIK